MDLLCKTAIKDNLKKYFKDLISVKMKCSVEKVIYHQ